MAGINGVQPPLPEREPVLRALVDICGPDFARTARAIDTVAGRRASFVAVPATARAVAATIELAERRGLAWMPRGSGSKIDWGTPPPGVDLIIDTGRLGGMWHHRVDEFTAEVGAGTQVRSLQAALALQGQRLAVDPRSISATVGGMLAVNESGALRHRFGTPAEQVVRISYVDASGTAGESDGEEGRPGIAEIDGVLMSARMRLQPLPAARRWVGLPVSTPLQVHHIVEETLASDLQPSAVEVDLPTAVMARPAEQPPGSVAVLLEGETGEAEQRATRLAMTLGGSAWVSEVAPGWWGRYPFGPLDVALRISVPIADLHAAVYALRDATGNAVPVRGSAGLGTVHAVLPGEFGPDRVAEILDSVRQVLLARSGEAVIVSAPPEISRYVEMAGRRQLF
ncbi:MAG TPA: FAD-binding oxidoreductase [Actinoplanes sp.]|nr:FAD-binding oxidoreductase [Actinoplanes sp.]